MAAVQEHWPAPDELFHWFGEANVSRDSQAAVVGISGSAVCWNIGIDEDEDSELID